MNPMKNRINLIYFTLTPKLTEYLKKISLNAPSNKKYNILSKRYNTNSLKVKLYDKVSTPFIDIKLFDDDE
ncbi:hypothetical protein HZQ94_01030 [Elizabethkingia anophelis]|nr:hypothetical protein [Elizabethkingia anophelis]MCT3679260.1 hypothetical protein [Elizabethkingia anophelis]MCT3769436.1 hypothetical protein [Elizabethkingia anophelis]